MHDSLIEAKNQAASLGIQLIRDWAGQDEGVDKRLDLLDVRNAPKNWLSFREITASDGQQKFEITVSVPCRELKRNTDSYLCSIWEDDSRPELCSTYPSNQYMDPETKILRGDYERLKKIHANSAPHCPILTNSSLNQILQKPLYR